jgi:hypothetical protein
MNVLGKITSLVAASIVGAVVVAPTAAASPTSEFCQGMAGVGFTGDCATMTALAQDVCAQYNRGLDLNAILPKLDAVTKNDNLSNYIVAGASVYFCPNHPDKT